MVSSRFIVLIGTFVVALLLALYAEKWIIGLAYRRHYFDSHSERKIHKGDVPRLGGIIFFPVSVLVLIAAAIFSIHIQDITILPAEISKGLGVVGAMFIMFIIGLVDDFKGVRYMKKFMGQILAGLLLCLSGLWINDLHGLFMLHALSPWVGWPLTIFAIIFVINAINFIDGIDGLAGSISSLGLCYYAYFSYASGNWLFSMLSMVMLACVLPYLYYNLTGSSKKKTKIFMGDTGSTILGLVLASLGILLTGTEFGHNPKTVHCALPLMIGLAPLVYPCYDTVRVVVHRVRMGNSPFKADKNHFHHKLLAIGMNQRKALITINCISITLIIIMVLASFIMNINLVLLISLVLWFILNLILTKLINNKTTITNNEEN